MDDGYFGPHSVTWRVHSSPVTLLGGIRALLVQALHPLAMAGVVDHSEFASDVNGRYRRTSDFLLASIFGDRATAEAAGARVRAVHRSVAGVDKVTGRPYSASDPELLLWVHCALVDSFLTANQRFRRPLDPSEADRYVAEMVRLGQLVGLHADDVPATVDALRARIAAYGPSLQLTPGAESAWDLLRQPPMPRAARPLWRLIFAASVSIMPDDLLRIYGRRRPHIPAPVFSAAVWLAARIARRTGKPPPVLAGALARARAEGVRL